MKNYINYHNHSSYSNVIVPDVTITNNDRANRAVELEQSALGFIEHGWAGRQVDAIELGIKNNIKPIIGCETYWVFDRFSKDKTNAHLMLLCKNENGRRSLNRILSEANVSGYYYRARTDMELILSLPPKDIWCTSSCIGGIWKYENHDEIIMKFFDHFKENFFLEVQNHNIDRQKEINRHILDLSNKYQIKITYGADSHFIDNDQKIERDNFLLSRGISYPEEEGWYLDYPSYQTAFDRIKEQGVLNNYQIEEALDNTNIFNDVEVYDSKIFDKNIIKIPTLYPNKNQEEKNKLLETLIWQQWDIHKLKIDESKWNHYKEEINRELDVVFKTSMADYFLLDYEVIKKGKEIGGRITLTGRGSSPSYFLCKLLGFTTIDRIAAPVKLFPERFISTERLLESKGIPDIDYNLGNPEVFAKAQEIIMGEGHSYSMIAFGTVKTLGAWKMYARVAGVDFDTANMISEQVSKYEVDYKHAETEEEKEELNVLDYIDEQYKKVFEESFKYLGLINSILNHPCGMLIYSDGDIREEFGLIKIKTGEIEHVCACCDGYFAEDYKLLKNDFLKVSVVDLIYEIYERIDGSQPHELDELVKICENNQKVWDVYKNALGVGVNQVEQNGTIERVAKYAPKNISELCAFIAAIRPGFKSNYKQFENREHFEYGILTLDKLIQTDEFPESYMLYQETAMQVMAFAGIPVSQTYDIIKNIAKKRVAKVLKYKTQFIEGMSKRLQEETAIPKLESEKLSQDYWNLLEENPDKLIIGGPMSSHVYALQNDNNKKIADMTWQIIEDSSRYSFNCSHSYSYAGDSLYCAYLKSHYPLEFYETFLRMMEESGDKDRLGRAKEEAARAFHIKFPKMKFGQDNRRIVGNVERNEITQSIKSIKGFGSKISEDMFSLSQIFKEGTFIDLLICAEENKFLSSKFEQLIKIGYFEDFGLDKKLINILNEFKSGKFRYNKTLKEETKQKRLTELKNIELWMKDEEFSIQEKAKNEIEITGSIFTAFDVNKMYAMVLDVNVEYSPKIKICTLKNNYDKTIKISKKLFQENPLKVSDIILCKEVKKKNMKRKNEEGKWVDIEDKFDLWLESYYVMKDGEKFLYRD